MWKQKVSQVVVGTQGRGFYDCTNQIVAWVKETGISEGLLTLFLQHTSASLVIQENADPDVREDLENFLERLVPDGDEHFTHTAEGPDDMPAHIRAVLTSIQLSIPVEIGRPALGTWQGIYVWEHRYEPHRRKIALHLFGQ